MTDLLKLLDRAEQLTKAASPAPWKFKSASPDWDERQFYNWSIIVRDQYDLLSFGQDATNHCDGDFICMARALILPLLDVARAAAAVEQEHHPYHLRERLREALAALAGTEVP